MRGHLKSCFTHTKEVWRGRPPSASRSPNDRASPARHTPPQLVSSFCCFPTTVYMQPGSLFISCERRSSPLCTLPRRTVYQLGLCRFTTLAHPASQAHGSRHHHMIPGSPSFAVRVVYSSHSAVLLSIIIKQNQVIPHNSLESLPLFFKLITSFFSLLIFPRLVDM